MRTLERRYRHWLRLFPKSHRAVYEDEMLGVLLAASRPGQRRVHLRDAANLARSAVSVRLPRLAGDETWQDAAAIVSLVAPLLLCVGMAATMIVGTTMFVIWPAVVALGLLGWRRAAASIAWLGFVAIVSTLPLSGFHVGFFGWYVTWLVLAGLAALSLTWSAGVRRGLELLGRGRAVAIASGVALLSLAELNEFNFGMRYLGEGTFDGTWAAAQTWFFLSAGLALLGVSAFRPSTSALGRAALLLVVPTSLVAWDTFLDLPPIGIEMTLISNIQALPTALVPLCALCGVLAAGRVRGTLGLGVSARRNTMMT